MNAEQLYEILKTAQEKKGYYFNKDHPLTMDILNGLLINKERYGYASCPCRLAFKDKVKDKDIICPCTYRDEDVENYGRCYCNLYVSSKVYNNEEEAADFVPDSWMRGSNV